MQQRRQRQHRTLSPFSIDPTQAMGEPLVNPSLGDTEQPGLSSSQAGSPVYLPVQQGSLEQPAFQGPTSQPYVAPVHQVGAPQVHPGMASGGPQMFVPQHLVGQGAPTPASAQQPQIPQHQAAPSPSVGATPQLKAPSRATPQQVHPGTTMGPVQLAEAASGQRSWAPASALGSGPQGPEMQNVRTPPVDVFDDGEALVIEFELPGVSKKDIDLVGRERGIVLEATSDVEEPGPGRITSEAGPRVYQREVPVDVEILPDEIEARFTNGILKVTLPKKDPTSGPRTIDIS